jgi:hypothetical protein
MARVSAILWVSTHWRLKGVARVRGASAPVWTRYSPRAKGEAVFVIGIGCDSEMSAEPIVCWDERAPDRRWGPLMSGRAVSWCFVATDPVRRAGQARALAGAEVSEMSERSRGDEAERNQVREDLERGRKPEGAVRSAGVPQAEE